MKMDNVCERNLVLIWAYCEVHVVPVQYSTVISSCFRHVNNWACGSVFCGIETVSILLDIFFPFPPSEWLGFDCSTTLWQVLLFPWIPVTWWSTGADRNRITSSLKMCNGSSRLTQISLISSRQVFSWIVSLCFSLSVYIIHMHTLSLTLSLSLPVCLYHYSFVHVCCSFSKGRL